KKFKSNYNKYPPGTYSESHLKLLLFILIFSYPIAGFSNSYPIKIFQNNPFAGSRFYVPNDEKKHTAIIKLHGSEGGSDAWGDVEANLLATQGFSVLAF